MRLRLLKTFVTLSIFLAAINTWGKSIERVDDLNEKLIHYSNSKIDSAIIYGEEALKLAENLNYKIGQITSLYNLGFCFYIKNEIDKSIYYSEKALRLSEESDYNIGKAGSLNNLGLIGVKDYIQQHLTTIMML
jgi:tetratricopeptide (TPR) repeat protein